MSQLTSFKQDKGPMNGRWNRFKPIEFSHRKGMDTSITCMVPLLIADLYAQVDEKGLLLIINTNKEKVIYE